MTSYPLFRSQRPYGCTSSSIAAGGRNPQHNFGLVHANLVPKPAYDAMQVAAPLVLASAWRRRRRMAYPAAPCQRDDRVGAVCGARIEEGRANGLGAVENNGNDVGRSVGLSGEAVSSAPPRPRGERLAGDSRGPADRHKRGRPAGTNERDRRRERGTRFRREVVKRPVALQPFHGAASYDVPEGRPHQRPVSLPGHHRCATIRAVVLALDGLLSERISDPAEWEVTLPSPSGTRASLPSRTSGSA